jgi:hypothetical protein
MKRPVIPPMLQTIVYDSICEMDGIEFFEHGACPSCGGSVKGHDIKRKTFARVIEQGKERDVSVLVKRFRCTRCGRLCYADAPFYPDTRLGSPVVDLAVTCARTMPFHRAARLLEAMNLRIDRGTIRNYTARDFGKIPYAEIFGYPVPLSLLHLSTVILRLDKTSPVIGAEILAACRHPSASGALPLRTAPREERDQRNKEKEKEERQPRRYPQ